MVVYVEGNEFLRSKHQPIIFKLTKVWKKKHLADAQMKRPGVFESPLPTKLVVCTQK